MNPAWGDGQCATCHGERFVRAEADLPPGKRRRCPACGGTGHCVHCGGSGVVEPEDWAAAVIQPYEGDLDRCAVPWTIVSLEVPETRQPDI